MKLEHTSHQTLYISLDHNWEKSTCYSMDRASQLLNFKFLPFLTFADWKVEEQVRKLCHKAKKNSVYLP